MILKKALAFILSAAMAFSAAAFPLAANADDTSVTIANFDKLYQKVWGGKEVSGHLDSTANGTVAYAGIADLAGDITVTLGWGLDSSYKVDAYVYAMPLLDTDKDGTATAEETDAYYAELTEKPSFTDASANLLASITDYNNGAGWTTYNDVALTTSANALNGKRAIFLTLDGTGKGNPGGYTGNFTYLNISATNVLGDPAGTCTVPVALTSQTAADTDTVFNVDIIYYGTSIKQGTVTLAEGAKTATANIEDVPVYTDGAEYTVSIAPAGYDFAVDSYNGTITAAVNGAHAVSADIYKIEDASLTLDDTFQASSNTKADLDLIAKAAAKGAASSDLAASDIITVEYDFVPGSASAHGYIDLRSNTGAESCSENADLKRYLITRIYSGWNQIDVADGATKFSGVTDIENHQKLNIAGKYNSNPTDTYHIKYTINYRTKTMQLDASSTSGSTSAFELTGFPSADKGSLYLSLYPDTQTAKNTWTVSNIKIGYKKAAAIEGATYTVALNYDGTIKSGEIVTEYIYGETTALPVLDDKENYTFAGWSESENETNASNIISAIPAAASGNKTYYAQWMPKKYTITFNSNGGSTVEAVTDDYNKTITLPTPTLAGHKLTCWRLNETTTYKGGASYTITGNAALTAEWEEGVALPDNEPNTLYVDASYDSSLVNATHFKSIRDAVAAAKKINPQSEAERITIKVMPGDYEEQVRIDGMKYLTLEQTPGTEEDGKVNLSWYFCTGYYTSNTDLNGLYDPKIDWSLDETWNGYNEGDEKFTKYTIGQDLSGVSTISYYDTDGVAHKDVAKNSMLDRLGGLAWSYDKMAPLIVTTSSSDITIKDFNLINSTVVMKTQGQDDGHLTPDPSRAALPDHKALTICDETTTPVKPTADIYSTKDGGVDIDKYKTYVASQGADFKFTAGESAWLAQSSVFNERGHAIAILGDRVICENLRVRGNQDSVWVSDGRTYFKNCDLIGGTDYIYGSAAVVFDNCKLGFAGFTDKSYGSPLATPNTPASRKYGYLFFNCTIYNVRDNNGANNFGGAWGDDGQSTFYNTTLDDKAEIGASPLKIEDKGWARFSAEKGLSRLYEFGTKNNSGAAVDLSKRVKNLSVAEGGTGMGTVLDKWQILEFNPRNVFSTKNDSKWSADWDPMNFAAQLADTDAEIEATTVSVPAGETTEVTLPAPTDDNVEFYWESNSTNAIVSEDGTKLTVVRPALGESAINSSVILYARNKTTGYGDKKEIPVTIAATTDTTNVFDIPVTITASVAPEAAVNYNVTLSKGGALIKSQTITMPLGSRTVTATIANVPASASGIDYDLKIVPESDEYSVKTPVDGVTTVKGITGADVPLSVETSKLVDQKVSLGTISYANTSGTQSYDLIALAKAAGAETDIESSDIITIEYDFVPASADAAGYMDIRSNEASSKNTNADNKRFALVKANASWHQLDTVDCTQGFSGASDSTHQWLNISGKYQNGDDITTTAHVITTINYKTKTITQSATGSGTSKKSGIDPYTFEGFPEAGKGSMYLYLYTDGGSWGVQNVSVTYKNLVVQKYTVTITGGEGIENVKLGDISGTKNGNAYTFTDVPAGEYTFDVTYTDGYEKADASPASITVSDDKTTETISAKLTEVTPPAPGHTYLDLLPGKTVKIEKKAGEDADSVVLEASVIDGLTDTPMPTLTVYAAVYDGVALKSVNVIPFVQNKATVTKPAVSGNESYRIFIWEGADSVPLLVPITAETTGNNKLF